MMCRCPRGARDETCWATEERFLKDSIYTKTGDSGTCALANGERVKKSSIRIDSYGSVDELNSWLGYCRALATVGLQGVGAGRVDLLLASIQHDLFVVGSDLAAPINSRFDGQRTVSDAEVLVLEREIDSLQKDLPRLTSFVLPAGTQLGSALHVARTMCRKCERKVVALAETEEINSQIIPFLNRLSDFLFVLARWSQHKMNCGDVLWDHQGGLRLLTGEFE